MVRVANWDSWASTRKAVRLSASLKFTNLAFWSNILHKWLKNFAEDINWFHHRRTNDSSSLERRAAVTSWADPATATTLKPTGVRANTLRTVGLRRHRRCCLRLWIQRWGVGLSPGRNWVCSSRSAEIWSPGGRPLASKRPRNERPELLGPFLETPARDTRRVSWLQRTKHSSFYGFHLMLNQVSINRCWISTDDAKIRMQSIYWHWIRASIGAGVMD